MLKKIILIFLTSLTGFAAFAQTPDEVYNKYLDFNLARLQGENNKVIKLGEELIPNAGKLPEKARTSFYFSIGKMYEDNDEPTKARPYYEKVAIAEPNYYVVHRALGYLYLADAKEIEIKLNTNPGNAELRAIYEKAARKALPELEKDQACDPSDDTLEIIKILHRNIKDKKGKNILNARLKEMSKSCIDILTD